MEFTIDFYAREDGSTPMVTFLDELRRTQPVLHKLLTAGLVKLRDRQRHGRPLTELVDSNNDMYEVRIGGTNIARAFFFFSKGQRIIVTNGYVKKTQKVDSGQLRIAQQYKADWERRNP